MNVTVLPNSLIFDGILDEETSLDVLLGGFEKLKKAGMNPPVNLDFSKVTYANSAGVVIWLKFIHQSGVPFKYVNAPVWLVNQFNMISDYFGNGSFVESIDAPFFAPKSQESRVFTLKLGTDVPVLDDYTTLRIPNKTADGKIFEIDFTPERYLSFISENYEMFKEKLSNE
jgi:hypothetical protein